MKKIFLSLLLALTLALCVLFVSCENGESPKTGDSPSAPELTQIEQLFDRAGLDDALDKHGSVLVKMNLPGTGSGYESSFYAAYGEDGKAVAEITLSFGGVIADALTYSGGVAHVWSGGGFEIVLVEEGKEFDYLSELTVFGLPKSPENYDYEIGDTDGGKSLLLTENIGDASFESRYIFDGKTGLITHLEQAVIDKNGNTVYTSLYEIIYGETYELVNYALNKHKEAPDTVPVSVVYGDESFGFHASRSSRVKTYPEDFRACKSPSLTKDAENLSFAEVELPLITLYLGKRANEIDFAVTLTRERADKFLDEIAELKKLLLGNGSLIKIEQILVGFDDKMDYFTTQYSLAELEYYKNMLSADASYKFNEATEIYFDIYEAVSSFCRDIYNSDSIYRDLVFEGWTEKEIEEMLSADHEIVALEEEMKALQDEHALLDTSSDTWGTDADSLYLEYIALAKKLAEKRGYTDYYDYASKNIYLRDYGREERIKLRENVKTYVVPAMVSAYDEFAERYTELSAMGSIMLSSILYSDPRQDEMKYIKLYTAEFTEDLFVSFDALFEKDALIISNSASAYPGAYTNYLDYFEEGYIFIGTADYITNFTLIHEMGHYASSYFCDLNAIGFDLAEIHSQANEWLFLSFLEEHLSREVYEVLTLYQLYSSLLQIVICTVVDEFEEEVYTNSPDTSDDLFALMEDIYKAYNVPSAIYPSYGIQKYRQMVTLRAPVYYVSYATSGLASLDIFLRSRLEGDKEGRLLYEELMFLSGEELGFTDIILNVGIASPFEDEFYKTVSQFVSSLEQ